ncbi:hypothetical protein [Undibacterium sp. RuRC25W]|uniref:hypothetical protein n=1 Tax=Undibacterium sp. RuRC25W TaxID=3413047 RepID=UPI003BF09749
MEWFLLMHGARDTFNNSLADTHFERCVDLMTVIFPGAIPAVVLIQRVYTRQKE